MSSGSENKPQPIASSSLRPSRRLRARYRAARRHRLYCLTAVLLTAGFLLFFFGSLIYQGYSAFMKTQVRIEFTYTPESVQHPEAVLPAHVASFLSHAWARTLPQQVEEDPALLGQTRQLWVTVSADVDLYNKDLEDQLTAGQRAAFEDLQTAGRARLVFNSDLFLNGDSKIATHAGLLASIMGTLYVMVVVLLISFPIGVATAIYLEEFAPDNRLTRIIQININNLAAVPSVLYGLLGLAIFINFMGVPRSSALVGGLTLSLMTLPYIIISSRAALLAVPQNIRHGALAMGASRWQAVRDHVLPLALPGILTGTIIGIAQAVGETAPLLLIGMIAFIPEAPTTVMDATTVLPAQIYSWASMPGQGYRALTAAGILILLATVIVLNGVAIILRNHFERRW